MATIDVIESEKLVQRTADIGGNFLGLVKELQKKHKAIGDVRGMGLMIGIEVVGDNKIPDPDTVLKVFEFTKEERLLIGKGGLYGNVIRISPPLNIEIEDIERAVKILDNAFKKAK
jgi:4-aminobutyrate aminotransferase-like enzyme